MASDRPTPGGDEPTMREQIQNLALLEEASAELAEARREIERLRAGVSPQPETDAEFAERFEEIAGPILREHIADPYDLSSVIAQLLPEVLALTEQPQPEITRQQAELFDALRELHEAATPGPWGWRGNDDGLVELRGHGPFGAYDGRVVSAQRSEPCTATRSDGEVALTAEACDDCKTKWAEMLEQGHTDMWEGYRCPKPENLATVWLKGEHAIEPANRWARREREYRSDVIAVDHPDAELIVAMRNALPDLLAVWPLLADGATPAGPEDET